MHLIIIFSPRATYLVPPVTCRGTIVKAALDTRFSFFCGYRLSSIEYPDGRKTLTVPLEKQNSVIRQMLVGLRFTVCALLSKLR